MNLKLTLFAIGTILLNNNIVESRKALGRSNKVTAECVCGESGEGVSNRIVGGIIVMPHLFPWVAAIFNKGALHCGGTLINDQYILTAGHCVKWTEAADLSVRLGMHNIDNKAEGLTTSIEKIILHEKFESNDLHDTNDIALIKLKDKVKYNDDVKPACLPLEGSDYEGKLVKVTGWGRVTTGGSASKFLREASLEVMPWILCRNTSFGEHVTESMLCAYTDNTDACQGDSGGPLLYEKSPGKYEVIGVVSWGIGCAKRGMPGVYVKNTDYLDWIYGNTKDATYCNVD